MDNIRVLLLGKEDWTQTYQVPEYLELLYEPEPDKLRERQPDLVFIDRQLIEGEYERLQEMVKAHTLYLTDQVRQNPQMKYLYDCKCGQIIHRDQIQKFLLEEVRFYFPEPYGEKYFMKKLTPAENFHGEVMWKGNREMVLQGDFGEQMQQVAYWRNTLPLFQGQVLDLWLEYKKDPGVEIELDIVQFESGSLCTVLSGWSFDEEQLGDVVRIRGDRGAGQFFAYIRAKGRGQLRIIALHNRYSRGSHGYFLPGGIRRVTREREEMFAYFDPGDRKPPLHVYFSGYKEREGFEGYYLMKKWKCPFLLLSEARLQGGSFYMGSGEYEAMYPDVIREYMRELDFPPEQVIFWGLSMGTTGAVYYGCDIRPHGIILGKPLMNLGDIAVNGKKLRRGEFATSLDVLEAMTPEIASPEEKVKDLNQRMWDKFDQADWRQTKFVVSYMMEDDYDPKGYQNLVKHLQNQGVLVQGRGVHGKHNDNTGGIVSWLEEQAGRILEEDFGRG